jgi:hypothetical protein
MQKQHSPLQILAACQRQFCHTVEDIDNQKGVGIHGVAMTGEESQQ